MKVKFHLNRLKYYPFTIFYVPVPQTSNREANHPQICAAVSNDFGHRLCLTLEREQLFIGRMYINPPSSYGGHRNRESGIVLYGSIIQREGNPPFWREQLNHLAMTTQTPKIIPVSFIGHDLACWAPYKHLLAHVLG